MNYLSYQLINEKILYIQVFEDIFTIDLLPGIITDILKEMPLNEAENIETINLDKI